MKIELAMKLEFQKLEFFFFKIVFKFAEKFLMVLKFMELEHHKKFSKFVQLGVSSTFWRGGVGIEHYLGRSFSNKCNLYYEMNI